MSDKVKVKGFSGTYRGSDGKSYGPFTATAEKPYLEVPLNVALISGAEMYKTGGAEVASDEDGVDVERLLEANHSLAADLKAAQDNVRERETRIGELSRDLQAAQDKREELEKALSEERTRGQQLEAALSQAAQAEAPAPASEAEGEPTPDQEGGEGTLLPEDFPLLATLKEHGFITLEEVQAGLKVAEGQEESPIRQIPGVGEKSENSIKDALIKAKVKNFTEPKGGEQ